MMSKQFTCDNCSCQFKSRSLLTWLKNAMSRLHLCSLSALTAIQHFITRKVLYCISLRPGKTESSITVNSELSPNNNDGDGQINSQFNFCGDADESVCAGPVSNNNNPHAKVSFHKKTKV
jgi:hypothetical protein